MGPKASNKVQYPVQEPGADIACPITQSDGARCRKRCLGEKRFRSMQEHIRRAHPEYYIPRLPATRESFELMINTPPHEIPKPPEQEEWSSPSDRREQHHVKQRTGQHRTNLQYYPDDVSLEFLKATGAFRRESLLPAASAAAALASLHGGDWRNDPTFYADDQDDDQDDKRLTLEDPTLSPDQHMLDGQYSEDNNANGSSGVAGHRSTAPAVQRIHSRSLDNSRRSSLTPNGKRLKHNRISSRNLLRPSHERKTGSVEPSAASLMSKRWEDLIDAATSVAEEDSREVTPLPASPFQSPAINARTSFTPQLSGSRSQTRPVSPLVPAFSPPVQVAPENGSLEVQPYNSTDDYNSLDTHHKVQASMSYPAMPPSNVTISSTSDSSTGGGGQTYHSSSPVQIYCAGCRTLSVLSDSFACTECICGLCVGCVDALIAEQARGRLAAQCPRCGSMGGRFKLFQLDVR